jgi:hypothetical protein
MSAACPPHLILLDMVILIILGQTPTTASLFDPNTPLSTLFSNLGLYSSLNIRDHPSRPFETTGRIAVLGISGASRVEKQYGCRKREKGNGALRKQVEIYSTHLSVLDFKVLHMVGGYKILAKKEKFLLPGLEL